MFWALVVPTAPSRCKRNLNRSKDEVCLLDSSGLIYLGVNIIKGMHTTIEGAAGGVQSIVFVVCRMEIVDEG